MTRFVYAEFRSVSLYIFFFFFKQKTAYDMRISDWSSDVCSSDLHVPRLRRGTIASASAHVCQCSCLYEKRRLEGRRFNRDMRSVSEIGRASCRERVCQYV